METVSIATTRHSALARLPWLLPAAAALAAAFAFRGYIEPLSLPFILGMAALPFSVQSAPARGYSRWAPVTALLFLGLSLLVPVRTLLFYGAGAVLACGAGLLGYRSRLLTLWNWILLSPMFAYLANAFSFPIRLQLAAWCGKLMAAVAVPVAIRGNVIEDSHGRFSIDPGCMGLNMLTASLLLGVLLVGYYERRTGRSLSAPALLGYIAVLLLLNVLSNVIRILVLVWCVWLPGTLLHELAGLGCLALYVGLPALLLAKWLVARGKLPQPVAYRYNGRRAGRIFLLLCVLCAAASVRVLVSTFEPGLPVAEGARIGAYTASTFSPGVLKLSDGPHLVYVKYVRGFYDLEHNPTICWSGNGYTFSDVEEATVGGARIYTAHLVQGSERLYTAWWYSNGRVNTNQQTEWRRRMLFGAPRFAVLNVTAASPEERDREVARLLRENTLAPLFRAP